MLPQSAAVAFVLVKVAVNGAMVERDLVVFVQVGAYLFGTKFAADKGVDVLDQLRVELIGFSPTLFDSPALPPGFFGAVLLPLGTVSSDFTADGAFVAVKLFGDFGDGAVAGQVLDVVSFVLGQLCVAHGNLSCRKGRMLPHTGLFLLWKVALQMRIRRRLKNQLSDGLLAVLAYNIQMISTSEIKVSVLIDEKYMELATRVLHKAFNLG